MADGTIAGLELAVLSDALGAELPGIDLGNVDDGRLAAIDQAWRRHLVLCFPGQTCSDEQFLAFSGRFGELDLAPITVTGEHDSSHNSAGETRGGFPDAFARRGDIPGAVHPLVCTHPDTGRKVLLAGRVGERAGAESH